LLLIICLSKMSFSQDTLKLNNAILLEYYQNQHFDQAVDYLKKTYPEPVPSVKVLKALAYCSQMNGKLPEAEHYYERIYTADSTSTSVLFNLANIEMSRGNITKAEVWYKKILLTDTTNFMVYKQLASIAFTNKDILKSINYFQKANRLNPEDADLASDFAALYINLKFYKGAEAILNKAINADPDNIILLETLVKLEYSQKIWPGVIQTAEKLVSSNDLATPVLTQLGIGYYNVRDYKCAIETFSQIAANEQSESSYYYTAECYKQLKDYDNAVSYFQKAIDEGISANINSYYSEKADTYETIKKFKKAETAYLKALQFTITPLTYYSFANMYDVELKNKKKAVLYYKKYLASKPDQKQNSYIIYAKSRIETFGK
jgi:tetratricopeptide (TPR) repeat protein